MSPRTEIDTYLPPDWYEVGIARIQSRVCYSAATGCSSGYYAITFEVFSSLGPAEFWVPPRFRFRLIYRVDRPEVLKALCVAAGVPGAFLADRHLVARFLLIEQTLAVQIECLPCHGGRFKLEIRQVARIETKASEYWP